MSGQSKISPVLVFFRARRCEFGRIAKERRPDYGARKRKREAAKIPLLADLPGMLLSAGEYTDRADHGYREFVRRMREGDARGWRRARVWRETATAAQRAEFNRRWANRWLPHTPEYALDIITQITREGVQ